MGHKGPDVTIRRFKHAICAHNREVRPVSMAGTDCPPFPPSPWLSLHHFVARGVAAFGALVRDGGYHPPENGVMRLPVWNSW